MISKSIFREYVRPVINDNCLSFIGAEPKQMCDSTCEGCGEVA